MKKYIAGFLVVLSVLTFTGASTASAQAMSLSQLVDLFISLGIISPEKAGAARSAVSSGASTSSNTSTIGTTTKVVVEDSACGQINRDLTVGSTGADVKFVQAKLGASQTGYFGPYTKSLVQKFQTLNGLSATGFFDATTRSKFVSSYCYVAPVVTNTPSNPTTSTNASASVKVDSSITTLTYDSSSKESQLTSTINISITAGSTDLNLFTSVLNAYFTGQGDMGLNLPSSARAQLNIGQGEKSDAYGRSWTTISAGKTVSATVILTANPKVMFAGTYRAVIGNLYSIDPSNAGGSITVPVSSNTSNSVTIVGEVSPYITSVTKSVSAGATMTIQGQRLSGSSVLLDGVSVTSSNNGSNITVVIPSSMISGGHRVAVNNPLTGMSNTVGFDVTGGIPQPTAPTVGIIGQPSLNLSYDSTNKESLLVATFNVDITAGSLGLNLYTDAIGASLFDQNNKQAGANSMTSKITGVSNIKTDQYGRNYVSLSAGQQVQVVASLNVNPKQLFAGTYHAVLNYLYGIDLNSSGKNENIIVLSNPTNSKTIIGELSPYMTSVTNSVVQGGIITAVGSRLGSVSAWIDGSMVNSSISINSSGTSLYFTIPTNLAVGSHSLQLKNSVGEASNYMSFTVTGASKPTITVISPNGGEVYKAGDTVNIRWNTTNFNSMKVWLTITDKYGDTVPGIGVWLNAADIPNTGIYSWTIPTGLVQQGATAAFRVVASSFDDGPSASDISDSFFSITAQTPVATSCTDSDGGINIEVKGLTDGRVNGIGSYFNDASVDSNGGVCTGTSCVAVAEGYCSNGAVTNYLYQCPSGYSVNGACATKPVTNATVSVALAGSATYIKSSNDQTGAAGNTTFTAVYPVSLQANNGSITFGLANSSWPAFPSEPNFIQVLKNGAVDPNAYMYQMSVAYGAPVGSTSGPDGKSFVVTNSTVTVPVTYSIKVPSGAGSVYALRLAAVGWSSNSQVNQSAALSGSGWQTSSIVASGEGENNNLASSYVSFSDILKLISVLKGN